MSVKQRLIEFIKYENIGQKKFAQAVGLSDGYVNAIRVSIQPDTVHKIAMQFPNLNMGWLLTGEGEMLKEKASNQSTSTAADDNILMSREVFNLIVSQQTTISNQNTVSQKNLETIQESIKMMLELMTKLTLQQTQISTSAQEEESAECADAV